MRRPTAGEGAAPWCSFCGKSHKEVDQVIAGSGCWICNECVDLCTRIIEKNLREKPKPKEASNAV